MNMRTLNVVADFVAMPDPSRTTWQRAVARGLVFMTIGAICILFGHWSGIPLSVGWMFGYIWGGLTVYGTMRPYLRS